MNQRNRRPAFLALATLAASRPSRRPPPRRQRSRSPHRRRRRRHRAPPRRRLRRRRRRSGSRRTRRTRRSGGRSIRPSTRPTGRRWTRCARSTAAPRRCRTRRTQADPRSALSQSKIEEDPRLKTMWAGYAFSVDFREERGHAYMLDDQTFTKRQAVVKQPGACMQCHASVVVPYRKLGNGDLDGGLPEDELDALPRGAQARRAPGRLHRLPRSRGP